MDHLSKLNKFENLLHVGLGKSASTTMQQLIFPKICEFKKRKLLSINQFLQSEKPSEDFIISNEMLLDWNPEHWNKSIKKIKRDYFNNKTHILLIIRNPVDYLSSVYAQCCLREVSYYKKINSFFIDNNDNNIINEKTKTNDPIRFFNISKFSYHELIDHFVSNFDKVTIVKVENLFKKDFLSYFFDLNNLEYEDLSKNINKFSNIGLTSFSVFCFKIIHAVYFFFYNNNLLSKTRKKFTATEFELYCDAQVEKLFSDQSLFIKDSNKRYKMNGKIKITETIKYFNIVKTIILRKILRKIFGTGYPFHFNLFAINRLNYVPSSKFKINFKKFPKININKLKLEYNDLPNFITYKN